MIEPYLEESILGRAYKKGLFKSRVVNIRDYAAGKHRVTDDVPYGGGAGMLMKPEPLFEAVDELRKDGVPRRIIMPSPQGRRFDQGMAEELSRETKTVTFICGRYEGVDERVPMALVDEEISVGDYVLTGGELAALVIIDAAVRLVPGVVGDERSTELDSFSWGVLDYPHYTRPPVYRGLAVPEVLKSGNHLSIEKWRRKEALRRTLLRRPELLLLEAAGLSVEDKTMIEEIKKEEGL